MGTTRDDIRRWFDHGVSQGATHLVVVCDTFEYEDYPVYVKPTEDVREVYEKYQGPNMQKVMEVYDLRKDREEQIQKDRVFNF